MRIGDETSIVSTGRFRRPREQSSPGLTAAPQAVP